MTATFKALLTVFTLLMQEDSTEHARELLQKLRSDKVEERDEAARKLKVLGKQALPELEKASKSGDVEVASRARDLIRLFHLMERLTPGLMKAMPGVEERLSAGDDHAWTEVFYEAIATDDRKRRKYPHLKSHDLDALVVPAIRGAGTIEEKKPICEAAGERCLRSAIPDIVALMKDRDEQFQWNLAYYLTEMRAQEAIPEVLKLLNDSNPHVRQVALSLLGRLGSRELIPEITKHLQSTDDWLRVQASQALIGLGAKEALPEIVKVIKSVGDRAGWSHTLGFKGLDAREVLPDLVALLKDDNLSVRSAAAGVLGVLGAKEAASDIAKLLDDTEAYSRAAAVLALGRLRCREAIPRITGLLKDEDRWVQRDAAKALALLGAREAIPAIIQLLDSAESNVRDDAAQALGMLKAREAVPAIERLLQNVDPNARFRAIHALAELRATETAPEIAKLLGDPEAYIRHEAGTGLCLMGHHEGVPVLLGEVTYLDRLNALRQPELWRRLDALRVQTPIEGTSRDILERLAKQAGMKLDCPSHPSLDRWWMRISWESIGLLDAVDDAAGAGFRFVLETDSIRVLSCDEALDFWRTWYAEQEKRK